MGRNLASDSAASASGSEPATIPQPANSRIAARVGVVEPRRSAARSPHSPSPDGVHPADGPGVPSTVHALELADQRDRYRGRRPADRRGRVQRRGEGQRRRVVGSDPGDIGRQVHDVARCRTNGVSGTFIEEQCGASASATERTAYSCSSRSLLDRASDAARARSRASSPVRRMVPARTRERTRPWSRRTSSSGVAPTRPSTANVQVRVVPLGELLAAASVGRSPPARDRAGRGPGPPCRARRALIRSTAAADRATSSRRADERAVGERHVGRGSAGADGPQRGDRREVRVVTDRRDPPAVTAPADDDLGDDQRRPARRSRRRTEKRAERHRPGTWLAHLVANDGVRHARPATRRPRCSNRSGPDDLELQRRGPSRPGPRRGGPTTTARRAPVCGSSDSSAPGSGIAPCGTDARAATRWVRVGRQRRRSRGSVRHRRITLRPRHPGSAATSGRHGAAPQWPP